MKIPQFVSSLFSRPQKSENTSPNPTTMQPSANKSLNVDAFIEDFKLYVASRYKSDNGSTTIERFANYARIAFASDAIGLTLLLIEKSNGVLNLPDSTLLIGNLKSGKNHDSLQSNAKNLTVDLGTLCVMHNIRHIAPAFYKSVPDSPQLVREAQVPCIRLYDI